MVAGAATLEQLHAEVYDTLAHMGEKLRAEARRTLAETEMPGQVTGLGSLFGLPFWVPLYRPPRKQLQRCSGWEH